MTILRVQTTIDHVSAVPENDVVNTLYFAMDDAEAVPESGGILGLVALIKSFYSDNHTVTGAAGGTAIKNYFSSELSIGANHTFTTKIYRLSDAEPRVPIHDEFWATPVAGAGAGMPGEVAIVLSFEGDKVSGLPQARRRGRIFVGPLKATAAAAGAGGLIRPSTACIEAIVGAAAALADASDDVIGFSWVVYSPTNDDVTEVTHGWVDDAFDTMRSRGVKPTARTQFAI